MREDLEFGDQELKREFMLRSLGAKSFIKVGGIYLDIKHCFGFGFEPDPDGYVIFSCCSVYDVNNFMQIAIPDRNMLCLFFLELEPFIDDENLLLNLTALIDEIDEQAVAEIERRRLEQPKRKRRTNKKD